MNYLPINPQPITIEQARELNPLVLAFVGDSVHQLYVRTQLSVQHSAKAGQLHNLATAQVKATAQAQALEKLLPHLDEDEMAIFKRARNSKSTTIAKHATLVEYKKASGYEALIGYLYLIGNTARLEQLINIQEQGEQ